MYSTFISLDLTLFNNIKNLQTYMTILYLSHDLKRFEVSLTIISYFDEKGQK